MATGSTARKRPIRPPVAQPETPVPDQQGGIFGNKLATVALVGVGAALIEAELIPGILIGVAAVMMPDILPKLGKVMRPLVKETVRAGYTLTERARESMAEMSEQVQDIVAEVKTEQHHSAPAAMGHSEEAPGTDIPVTEP